MFSLVPWRRSEGTALQRDEHPLNRFRDEFDSLFDRFFGGWPGSMMGPWEAQPFWGVDVQENDKEVSLRFEAPGFEVGDFDVQVSGNTLTARAERKQEAKDKEDKERPSYSERRFQRSVTLPAGTDATKAEAHYRNGVLELRLPRSQEAQPKRIAVQGA
jgi:HSP20 family protein